MSALRKVGRTARTDEKAIESVSEPATGASAPAQSPAVAEVASYIAQMTAEMGQMAGAAKLEVLAYLFSGDGARRGADDRPS